MIQEYKRQKSNIKRRKRGKGNKGNKKTHQGIKEKQMKRGDP